MNILAVVVSLIAICATTFLVTKLHDYSDQGTSSSTSKVETKSTAGGTQRMSRRQKSSTWKLPKSPTINIPKDVELNENDRYSEKDVISGRRRGKHLPTKNNITTVRQNIKVYKATNIGITQLVIPKGAKVVRGSKNKMRADKAYVTGFWKLRDLHSPSLELQRQRNEKELQRRRNEKVGRTSLRYIGYKKSKITKKDRARYKEDYIYRKDNMQKPDMFDRDTSTSCSHGIHFFPTFREAVKWWR